MFPPSLYVVQWILEEFSVCKIILSPFSATAADFNEFSKFLFSAVFVFLPSTTAAIKCYVCGGSESEHSFLENNSSFNDTIKQKITQSCDEFDRIPLEEKFKYEMTCPDGYEKGCMLKVGGKHIFFVYLN
jgi:hypothetical protein